MKKRVNAVEAANILTERTGKRVYPKAIAILYANGVIEGERFRNGKSWVYRIILASLPTDPEVLARLHQRGSYPRRGSP